MAALPKKRTISFDEHPLAPALPLFSDATFIYPAALNELAEPQLLERFMRTWTRVFVELNSAASDVEDAIPLTKYRFPNAPYAFLFAYAAPWSPTPQAQLLMLIASLPNVAKWLLSYDGGLIPNPTVVTLPIAPLVAELVARGQKFPFRAANIGALWLQSPRSHCSIGTRTRSTYPLVEPHIECHHRALLSPEHLHEHPEADAIRAYFAKSPMCPFAFDIVRKVVPPKFISLKMVIIAKIVRRNNPDCTPESFLEQVRVSAESLLASSCRVSDKVPAISRDYKRLQTGHLSKARQCDTVEAIIAIHELNMKRVLIGWPVVCKQALLMCLVLYREGYIAIPDASGRAFPRTFSSWKTYQETKEAAQKRHAAERFFRIMDRIPTDLYHDIVDMLARQLETIETPTVWTTPVAVAERVLMGAMGSR
jgi:hypothetical protein